MRNGRVPHTRDFVHSAELYDAIYHYKNYERESERLRRLIEDAAPGARGILDVACGTGEHAKFLKRYYAVDGVDINEDYLAAARVKNPAGNYTNADMMDFDRGRTYDVVTCLFSAIGIVKTYERLERAIACMARHLTPDGALIVEPWFTPEAWSPGRRFILDGVIGSGKVHRMSSSLRRGQVSVLANHYLRSVGLRLEHYRERIELGLFTRDEMTWAFEFAGMRVRYEVEGLMGRGLYIAVHNSKGEL